MKRYLGPLCFLSFCFLIATRDVLIDRLQVCEKCIRPTGLLLIWSIECALLAWLVRSIRKRSFAFITPFLQLERQQQFDFVKLGFATFVVYVVTVFGIRALTAQVFNLFDYGIMPVLTLLTAYLINKERILVHQVVGAFFSVFGIGLLLSALIFSPVQWQIWIGLAFLSPLFTSICSSLQRRQVAQGMTPDEVLLYRFPIPAILMIVWVGVDKFKAPDAPIGLPLHDLPALLLVGALTVFLPLWLLCRAFVRSSVGQLASYLFLIAVFTFVLAPLVVARAWNPARMPAVWVSAVLLLVGYLVAEGLIKLRTEKRE